jgi:hypothetical protein
MVQKGLIEKVVVPSKKKSSNSSVKCIRLIGAESNETMDDELVLAEDIVDAGELGNVNIRNHKDTH